MIAHTWDALIALGALLLGGSIGFIFGSIQNAAFVRHRRLQARGKLESGWALLPGSMRRTALLIMTLFAVQILCPLIFDNATLRWLVSAAIVVGYGWTLLKRERDQST